MDILVLESSTTSAKAMIYDTVSHRVQTAEKAWDGNRPDHGMQDPEDVFHQTLVLARQLCSHRKIEAIALSGTYHSVMLCDRDMKPESPSYLWSYTGAKELCARLRKDKAYVSRYYLATGCMVHSIYPFFKLKHFKEQGIHIDDCYIMDQGSYNFFRLTGVRKVMDSMASGSGLFNINFLDYDRDLLNELGIDQEQLPRLAQWNETSPLTAEAADWLGVKAGISVMTAGPDGAFNQVGSDALSEGIMTLSMGTSAALRMSVPKPRFSEDNSTWCYRSPKKWLSGAAVSGCCNCVDWIKVLMFPGQTYEDCEKGIGQTDKAPVFLPFLYGERCPGWNDERQAAFCGVLPHHTSFDFYYSVLEGVLFNIFQCFQKLCGLNGRPRKIKISGGILNSPRWLQMCADVLGQELILDTLKQSSMAGGLILALELFGLKLDHSALETEKSKIMIPQKQTHERYMDRFKRYEIYYNQDRR